MIDWIMWDFWLISLAKDFYFMKLHLATQNWLNFFILTSLRSLKINNPASDTPSSHENKQEIMEILHDDMQYIL